MSLESLIKIPKLESLKPADLGISYLPISFLCPTIQVLERSLHPELISLSLLSTQCGIHSNQSTVSALLPLAQEIGGSPS